MNSVLPLVMLSLRRLVEVVRSTVCRALWIMETSSSSENGRSIWREKEGGGGYQASDDEGTYS